MVVTSKMILKIRIDQKDCCDERIDVFDQFAQFFSNATIFSVVIQVFI